MKTYKEYLAESKRTFSYRVRIADCDMNPDLQEKIEVALAAFKLRDISKPKSMPITRYREFAALGPVGCHQFEIVLDYPCRPDQVQQTIANGTGIPVQRVFANDLMADEMQPDPTSQWQEGPILTKELPSVENAQDMVGEKRTLSLLAELGKEKYQGEQYKGVNDDILAKSMPAEKPAKVDTKIGTTSPLGSLKINNPDPRKGRK